MNFIDLFCGCGGLTEGFIKENYKPLLLSDNDPYSMLTSENRLTSLGFNKSLVGKICKKADLTNKKNIPNLLSNIDNKLEIDVLVAGIPCQAYSSVGRAQDADSMKNDKRNYLYKSLINFLNILKPNIVLIENVSGMLSARPKDALIIKDIFNQLEKSGYNVHREKKDILLNSLEYGVPQVRKRVIIFGVKKSLRINPVYFYEKLQKTHYEPNNKKKGLKKFISVNEAIGDLPKIKPGKGKEFYEFFKPKINRYLKEIRKKGYRYLHNHTCRSHNEKDKLRYFYLSKNNWQLKDLQHKYPELIHHDPKHFGNRYTVQAGHLPGRTVVSHLYKDGNLFIHPDYKQTRTFTVREAARIQSFPDDFIFSGSRTQQFKQVGNAVPVLLAKALAKTIKILR